MVNIHRVAFPSVQQIETPRKTATNQSSSSISLLSNKPALVHRVNPNVSIEMAADDPNHSFAKESKKPSKARTTSVAIGQFKIRRGICCIVCTMENGTLGVRDEDARWGGRKKKGAHTLRPGNWTNKEHRFKPCGALLIPWGICHGGFCVRDANSGWRCGYRCGLIYLGAASHATAITHPALNFYFSPCLALRPPRDLRSPPTRKRDSTRVRYDSIRSDRRRDRTRFSNGFFRTTNGSISPLPPESYSIRRSHLAS